MTYVPTWQGFIFLAIVLDVWWPEANCSRRVVGWKIGDEMTAQLVIDALNMAGTQRKPTTVIHHSDQGSQYTSLAFGNRCKVLGVRPSMAPGQPLRSVGDAYDNAMAESFFASLECELLDRKVLKTRTQARLACSLTSKAGTTHVVGTVRSVKWPEASRSRRQTLRSNMRISSNNTDPS